MTLLQSQLDEAKQAFDKTHADLMRAEKRLDRMRCASVREVEAPPEDVSNSLQSLPQCSERALTGLAPLYRPPCP